MTPYWPSPLGATYRPLNPNPRQQETAFATELFGRRGPAARRFPRPNRGIKWVAEADLPSLRDLDLGASDSTAEAN